MDSGSMYALKFANIVVNFALGGIAIALRYLAQAAQTLQERDLLSRALLEAKL